MQSLRDQLRHVVSKGMAQDTAHDLAHLDRVWANACKIAADIGDVDRRVLMAACYLHDLVNLSKDAPNRAECSTLAAEAAEPVLHAMGFAQPEIAAAQHAIRAHSFSAGIPPETIEARILRDADRLDALGAIGIARCFAVSGGLGRALYDGDDPFATGRALDDKAFALDHWPVKLLRLPEDMLTEAGRVLAQERCTLMLRFLRDLAGEIDALVPSTWGAEA